MITLSRNNDQVNISVDGAPAGSVLLYNNPYHRQNQYIRLSLDRPDTAFSAELFEKLHQIAKRPLQAMVDSDDAETVTFLTAGGFVCKRKCYEVEAAKEDWLGARSNTIPLHTRKGTPEYDQCCQIIFRHYTDTHRGVNPWTAGFPAFLEALPDDVLYETADGSIVNLAFVDGSEIAYLYSSEPTLFPSFAAALTEYIFSVHETLCFESDDCDRAAMELRAMFAGQSESSYDTYVYGEI